MIKKYNLLFIKYTVLFITITLLFILPIQLKAEEKGTRFYFGILGNKSESTFTGKAGNDLSNGDVKSKLNPSAIIGIENRANMTEKGNLKLLLGGEIYYDKIDKTIVQSDRKYYTAEASGYKEAKNAGKDIYTTDFLLGARIKAGFELFKRVSLYGLVGLNYWDRDVHVERLISHNLFKPDWKLMPSYGFGAGINLTKNFELNFNYMRVVNTYLKLTGDEYRSVECGDSKYTKIQISVITFGLKYKF